MIVKWRSWWPVSAALVIGFVLGGATARDGGPFGPTVASWVQAIGAIIAVYSGFALAAHQRRVAQTDAGEAAAMVAFNSIERVTDRLDATVQAVSGNTALALRGEQARELVNALTQVNISTLPADLISPVASLRAALMAINARIDEIYRTEEREPARKSERLSRLRSAALVLLAARREFKECFPVRDLGQLPNATVDLMVAAGGQRPFV